MKFQKMKLDNLKNKTLCLVFLSLATSTAFAGKSFTYSYLGNTSANVSAKPISCHAGSCTPSVVLMGGGYDVGEAFRWMISQAGISQSTGGKFVIIRATGTDAYNPYVYSHLGQVDTTTPRNYEMVGGADLGLTSVETLVIPSRTAAEDPFVLNVVSRASAIFIAGGNQADYYNYWQGTSLDNVLQKAVNSGIPVGGTSAGNAMLGQYAYAALNGSVTSSEALGDPFNKYMTIDPLNTSSNKFIQNGSFINIAPMAKAITDDHLNTRDRLGRLFSFVARIGNACAGGVENVNDVLGVGIDEETALLVFGPQGKGKAEMVANPYNTANTTPPYTAQNSAYFIKIGNPPSQCVAGKPLIDNAGVQVYRLSAQPSQPSPYSTAPQYSFKIDAAFDISNWPSQNIQTYRDGSSLNGPYYYGTSDGAVQGNSVY
jgi:cyanophycinase-like exopeptidase